MDQWMIQQKTVCGLRNCTQGLECQDQLASFRHGDIVALALADGTGRDDYAAQGAYITAQVLAKMLAGSFDRLYAAAAIDPLFVRHNVLTNILRNQRKLLPGGSIKQIQSTALAVSVDPVRHRYLYIHLGDGRICVQKNGSIFCLSDAENGFGTCETYLTSSSEAISRIRCGFGSTDGVDAFFIASDGGYEILESVCTAEKFLTQSLTAAREDDIGIGRIFRDVL